MTWKEILMVKIQGNQDLKSSGDRPAGQPVMFFFQPTGKAKIPAAFFDDKKLSFAPDPATVAFK